MTKTMEELLRSIPQVGKVEWLGVRPAARAEIEVRQQIEVDVEHSILGDHYRGAAGSKRQVTLLQSEHLDVLQKILGVSIVPEMLRRNIVVSGINLQSLKGHEFQIGGAILKGTGNCPPCSRMEENLGPGGYNAMRGHGGLTAQIVQSGTVCVGDRVRLHNS